MWKQIWDAFRILYGPALLGGVLLVIADLTQNDHQGQIIKLGGMIKRHFMPALQTEAMVGAVLTLVLGVLLCWVFRPASPSDSLAKGASVFALLAALVPAQKLPGVPVGEGAGKPPSPPASAGPAPKASTTLPETLAGWAISHARADAVVPVTPVSKARITLMPAADESKIQFFRRLRTDGVEVWLLDSKGEPIAYERVTQPQFTVLKPAGDYILEFNLAGYWRARAPLKLDPKPKAYDVSIGESSVVPLGVQRLFGPERAVLVLNEAESFKFHGAELSRRGDFQLALALYDKALQKQPNDRDALNFKGYALYKLGRLEEATKALDAALQADPSHHLARINAAKVACRRGNQQVARNAVLAEPMLDRRLLAVVAADGEFRSECAALAAEVKHRAGNL
jgi:hypothetical protein